MSEITTVGLDLAKRVVSLCGEDAGGRVVLQRTLRREAVLVWFVQRPPCLVGMEACASAHWFAREFVRPFRLSGKNDANDAAAICAAVRQPQLRFVAVKSAEQQARLVVHRLRQCWQEERTAGLNRLRGLLAEFGRVYPNSAAAALTGARAALADETLSAAWIVAIYERIGYHKTLVAIANKHARLIWVLLDPRRAAARACCLELSDDTLPPTARSTATTMVRPTLRAPG